MRLAFVAALITGGAVSLAALPASAAEVRSSGASIDLQTLLEKGLKARRPQEFTFIRHVVARVDDGTLPVAVVKSTFSWARDKRPYPIVFFEKALKIRAKKLGVAI